jgi:3-oxoacyl-[acyl-carrier protein] reductase
VIVYSSSDAAAAAVVEQVVSQGGRAKAIKADLTKDREVQDMVAEAKGFLDGAIDILIAVTGGIVGRRALADLDQSFWHRVIDLNLTSLFLTCQAVVPHMTSDGAIVTFASQAGRDGGGSGALAYATAKGGVMTFTRALAKELAPAIRVNSVCPGMIDTTFHDQFTRNEVRANVAAATPLKREGRSEEVAKLVAWLASDEASFMTGTCVDINGGILFS